MSEYKYKLVIEVWGDSEDALQYILNQTAGDVDMLSSTEDFYIESSITKEED